MEQHIQTGGGVSMTPNTEGKAAMEDLIKAKEGEAIPAMMNLGTNRSVTDSGEMMNQH